MFEFFDINGLLKTQGLIFCIFKRKNKVEETGWQKKYREHKSIKNSHNVNMKMINLMQKVTIKIV